MCDLVLVVVEDVVLNLKNQQEGSFREGLCWVRQTETIVQILSILDP